MILLKNIPVMMVLLFVMLPCGHATEVHGDDYGLVRDVCDRAETSCECHADNHSPCADKQIPFISPPAPKRINATPVFQANDNSRLPENELPINNHNPVLFGVLSSILTVQLLI